MRLVRLALLVALVAAVPASAQEPPLPEGAVARVGDELVLESDFDTWYVILGSETKWLTSDPPDFDRCIATLDKRAAKRGRHPTRRSLRRRCEERAQVIHDTATYGALLQVWVRQEATRVGVSLSLQQVARRVARVKREASAEDRRVLARLTDAQLAAALAYSMLFVRLTERVVATFPEVTPARVKRYYAQHRRRYRHLSRERALKRIEARLELIREYRAAARFLRNLSARYVKQTECAEGYVVDWCGNAQSKGSDVDGGSFPASPARGMLRPV